MFITAFLYIVNHLNKSHCLNKLFINYLHLKILDLVLQIEKFRTHYRFQTFLLRNMI